MIIVQQGLKIIKFRDIADGNLIYTNDKNGFVKESVVTKKALRVLKAGDVLITSAAHSGENIGKKTAYVRTLPDKLPVIYFTGELLNIRSIQAADTNARSAVSLISLAKS